MIVYNSPVPRVFGIKKLQGIKDEKFNFEYLCETINEVRKYLNNIRYNNEHDLYMQILDNNNSRYLSCCLKRNVAIITFPIDSVLISTGFELGFNSGKVTPDDILNMPFKIELKASEISDGISDKMWDCLNCVLDIYYNVFDTSKDVDAKNDSPSEEFPTSWSELE